MIEAPSIKKIINSKDEIQNVLTAILFAPKFSKSGFDDVIKRFGYLDNRTGNKLNIYCCGYGAYWNDEYAPDREDIDVKKYQNGNEIHWQFSQQKFADCVNEIEEITTWKYSGGSELILFNSNFDFKNCIIFKIDEMLKDEIIDFPGELFEALIQYSRKERNSIHELSMKGKTNFSSDEIIESIVKCLPKQFDILNRIWKKNKHYSILDLS